MLPCVEPADDGCTLAARTGDAESVTQAIADATTIGIDSARANGSGCAHSRVGDHKSLWEIMLLHF